jgi:hypothetical protein
MDTPGKGATAVLLHPIEQPRKKGE